MTKLEEFRKLADAAMNETAPYVRAEALSNYWKAARPREVHSMCDLLERMRHVLANGPRFADSKDAVDTFDEWNKEK